MRLPSATRVVLIVLILTVGLGTAVFADGGRIRFNVVKAGFVIGGSGGSGTAPRWVPVGPGGGIIVLINQNGAVLTVSGRQVGLIVAADLNGLVITLR